MTDSERLADRLAAVILERGPTSGSELAWLVRTRKQIVLRVLRDDRRFVTVGKGRGARVELVTLDVDQWRRKQKCSARTATEIFFGPDGFEERGYVVRVNGNGKVVPTTLGLRVAGYVMEARPE